MEKYIFTCSPREGKNIHLNSLKSNEGGVIMINIIPFVVLLLLMIVTITQFTGKELTVGHWVLIGAHVLFGILYLIAIICTTGPRLDTAILWITYSVRV